MEKIIYFINSGSRMFSKSILKLELSDGHKNSELVYLVDSFDWRSFSTVRLHDRLSPFLLQTAKSPKITAEGKKKHISSVLKRCVFSGSLQVKFPLSALPCCHDASFQPSLRSWGERDLHEESLYFAPVSFQQCNWWFLWSFWGVPGFFWT